jgi:hypothetical protein
MRNICDRPHPAIAELNPDADPFLIQTVDTMLQKDPAARGESARWVANQLRGWLTRNEILDIVEHVRAFIGGLGLQSNQTMVESGGSGSRFSRPGTGSGPRQGSGFPSRLQSASTPGGTLLGGGARSTYAPQPTTGTMGPSSRSPLVWIGAFLTVAILALAGVILWSSRSQDAKPAPAVAAAPKEPKPAAKPPTPAPADPLAAEPALQSIPRPSATEPRAAAQRPRTAVQPKTEPRPRAQPRPAAAPRPVKTPAPAPEPAAPKTGFILVKSAPPFAALTINGKPQGETPMSSWLEVPAGKCHIEIVHRLTPPFDTVITVSTAMRREFKFKLDR